MDVKESARHIIRIQYIKVKYNSIPLIINENVFIFPTPRKVFVKILIKSKINCWVDLTFSLRFNKYLFFERVKIVILIDYVGSFRSFLRYHGKLLGN